MFYGGTISQWIGLIEYCGIMIILFVFTGVASCILANKTSHTNKEKNNFKHKKIKKKSYFIDVA